MDHSRRQQQPNNGGLAGNANANDDQGTLPTIRRSERLANRQGAPPTAPPPEDDQSSLNDPDYDPAVEEWEQEIDDDLRAHGLLEESSSEESGSDLDDEPNAIDAAFVSLVASVTGTSDGPARILIEELGARRVTKMIQTRLASHGSAVELPPSPAAEAIPQQLPPAPVQHPLPSYVPAPRLPSLHAAQSPLVAQADTHHGGTTTNFTQANVTEAQAPSVGLTAAQLPQQAFGQSQPATVAQLGAVPQYYQQPMATTAAHPLAHAGPHHRPPSPILGSHQSTEESQRAEAARREQNLADFVAQAGSSRSLDSRYQFPDPYDGTGDFEDWKRRFNIEASVYAWTGGVKKVRLLKCLAGSAQEVLLRWIHEGRARDATVEDMLHHIDSEFNGTHFARQHTWDQEFFQMTQHQGESIHKFYLRFTDVATKSGHLYDEHTPLRFAAALRGSTGKIVNVWAQSGERKSLRQVYEHAKLTDNPMRLTNWQRDDSSGSDNEQRRGKRAHSKANDDGEEKQLAKRARINAVGVKEPGDATDPQRTDSEKQLAREIHNMRAELRALSHEQLQAAAASQRPQQDPQRPVQDGNRTQPLCWVCNRPGHRASACRFRATSRQQPGNPLSNVVCHHCNKRGHRASECRSKFRQGQFQQQQQPQPAMTGPNALPLSVRPGSAVQPLQQPVMPPQQPAMPQWSQSAPQQFPGMFPMPPPYPYAQMFAAMSAQSNTNRPAHPGPPPASTPALQALPSPNGVSGTPSTAPPQAGNGVTRP